MKRKVIGALTAAVMCVSALPAMSASAASVGDTLSVGNGQNQHKGNCDGYSYEIWLDNTGGSGSMKLGKGATFDAQWSASVNRGNFLARRGLDFGSRQKATSYDYIGMDYNASYQQTGSASGNSRLCVYGWFQNQGAGNVPLVEYYIIEDWVDWCPDGNGKMVTIDNAQYKIFQMDHTGPSINSGNETFKQYFSVRQSKRTSGHITVSDHFKAWADQGWGIGNLYEVALNAEGWQSSGRANVSTLDVYTDPEKHEIIPGGDDDDPTPSTGSMTADANGYYFNEGFESGVGDAGGRSSETVSSTSDCAYSGSKAALCSNRSEDWNGVQIPVSLTGGETYSFGAAVASKSANDFKMTMECDGEYIEIATASAKAGEWTAIGNTSFTAPSGASSAKVYIETPGSTDDFYVDDFFCAVKGKANGAKTGGGSKAPTATTTGGDDPYTPPTGGEVVGGKVVLSAPGNGNPSSNYLKDAFGNFFRMGTSVSPNELNGSQGQTFIKNHFNSITPENALKPDSIINQGACSGTNTAISLGSVASTMKFCQDNGIAMRGHTFVWYSQTPDWFFRENFNGNGGYVNASTMDARLESMIKNTFSAIKSQYPNLKLYSYDVCNELFVNDGGGLRPSNNSNWVRVYGGDSFVTKAFQLARKYAPADCQLCINDYNEYMDAKCNDIYNMAKKVLQSGDYIDGIGMQSHLDTSYPNKSVYGNAMKKFLSTGLQVQITELDITCSDFNAQASLYKDIFSLALENYPNVPAVTVWGTMDPVSWRSSQNPLLFGSNYSEKPAYKSVIELAHSYTQPTAKQTTVVTTTKATTTQTTTTTKTVTTTQAPVGKTVAGDANCDGKLSIADAVLVSRFANEEKGVSINAQGRANADCDGDNEITANDASLILKGIARLIRLS